VGPDGKPLSGAAVLADNGGSYQVMKEWDETPWRNWVSDPIGAASTGPYTRRAVSATGADGRFRVERVPLPAGKGWVVVVHPDFATARLDANGEARNGVLDVGDVALRPGAAVKATVRSAGGKPVAGAWVVARSATPSSPAQSPSSWAHGDEPGDVRVGRTGDDGTCVVRGLTPGSLRVAAFSASDVPAVVEAEGTASQTVETSITLVSGATLRVEVVSRGTNAPVAGARVMVDRPEAGMSWPGPPPLARVLTDETGVAAIAGLETLPEYRVTVVPRDFAADSVIHPGGFHVSGTAKPGETVRFALTPARTFSLRVVDARTKEPLPGAKVELRPVWDRFDHSGGQATDLHLAWDPASKSHVTTMARPGPWIASVWAQGHVPRTGTEVTVKERSDESAPPAVQLDPATASATGRVVDKTTGKPVVGATVASYEWFQPLGDGNRAAATTSEDGAFRLSALVGEGLPLRLEVAAPGYVTAVAEWPEAKRPTELGDVSIQRAAAIRGRVTRADGRSLARVEVVLSSFDSTGRGKGDGWSATTDDDGRFSFTGIPPGRYRLEGQRERSPIVVAEGETGERDLVR
jgi:protocatechuate 3,4-dioxygenase beta subunit